MIKLKAVPKPAQLTPEKQVEFTKKFKEKGTEVWRKKYITDLLFQMSHGKCCFSEMKLREEGKDLQVEHFNPKKLYPDEVIEWENLLPISNHCNRCKKDWDTKAKPIIHPVKDNPKDHLSVKNGWFRGKDEKGKNTIQATRLNDMEQLYLIRCQLIGIIYATLEKLNKRAKNEDLKDDFLCSSFLEDLENLMKKAIPEAEYSATVATVILHDENYSQIKNILENKDLWSEELADLETQMQFCALEESTS